MHTSAAARTPQRRPLATTPRQCAHRSISPRVRHATRTLATLAWWEERATRTAPVRANGRSTVRLATTATQAPPATCASTEHAWGPRPFYRPNDSRQAPRTRERLDSTNADTDTETLITDRSRVIVAGELGHPLRPSGVHQAAATTASPILDTSPRAVQLKNVSQTGNRSSLVLGASVRYARPVAYRDDLASTQERADQLAADLAEERQRVAQLTQAVASRDTQLDALRRRFDGMPAAARVRVALVVSLAFVLGALLGAWLDLPSHHVQAAIPPEPAPAAPPTEQPDIAIADTEGVTGLDSDFENTCNCNAGDVVCTSRCIAARSPSVLASKPRASTQAFAPSAEKSRLYHRVASGTATLSEMRQLKALCMLDGDRACRAMAVDALAASKSR